MIRDKMDLAIDEIGAELRAPVLIRERLAERNRANAAKSTGPRSEAGKAASSRNSLRHGLTAKQVVIEGESQEEFDALLASIIEQRKPEGELECQYVGEIGACLWRLNRARRYESTLFDIYGAEAFVSKPISAGLDRMLRYMGAIERQLNRAIVRLDQMQAERRRLEDRKPAPKVEPEKPKTMAADASSGFVSSTEVPVTSNTEPPAAETSVNVQMNRQSAA